MIGTVKFYRLPGSMSSNEYPIRTPDQDISAYLVHTENNCKFTKDLLQAIGPIKVFEGYENVNVAELNNEFYWIVNKRTESLQLETVTYGLSYNAPLSNLRIGQSVTGAFTKTPVQLRDYMSNAVSNDTMEYSRHIELPHNPTVQAIGGDYPYTARRTYWVEVITITLERIGFFIWDNRYNIGSGSGSPYSCICCGGTDSSSQNRPRCYPPSDFFKYPVATLGIPADEISEIHISERCPYAYTVGTVTWAGTTFETIYLSGHSLSRITREGYADLNIFVYKDLEKDNSNVQTSLTMTLSEMERACGSIRFVNESGNAIASIPTQYGDSITLTIKPISDIPGLFTEISYNGRVMTVINEGMVPFYGSAWETYKAYSMSFDREQVSINKRINNAELEVQLNQSRGNAILGIGMSLGAMDITNPVGLVGGAINIAGQIANEALTENAMNARNLIENKALDMNQQLLEKRMAVAPGTTYDTGYGFIYIYNCENHPANLRLEMPANLTQSYYETHVAEFGYPSEGVSSFNLTPGYIQGRLLNNGVLVGERFDELNRTIGNGFKIKAIQ